MGPSNNMNRSRGFLKTPGQPTTVHFMPVAAFACRGSCSAKKLPHINVLSTEARLTISEVVVPSVPIFVGVSQMKGQKRIHVTSNIIMASNII